MYSVFSKVPINQNEKQQPYLPKLSGVFPWLLSQEFLLHLFLLQHTHTHNYYNNTNTVRVVISIVLYLIDKVNTPCYNNVKQIYAI